MHWETGLPILALSPGQEGRDAARSHAVQSSTLPLFHPVGDSCSANEPGDAMLPCHVGRTARNSVSVVMVICLRRWHPRKQAHKHVGVRFSYDALVSKTFVKDETCLNLPEVVSFVLKLILKLFKLLLLLLFDRYYTNYNYTYDKMQISRGC